MAFQVTFNLDSSTTPNLIATVTGAGDGGVENGMTVQSISFECAGSIDLVLGPAKQSVSSFHFTLGTDTADFIVILAADLSLTVLPTAGSTFGTPGPVPADPSVLTRFFGGMTQANVSAAISGALEAWIVTNAAGIPALIIMGFLTEGYGFVFAIVGQAADLGELFVEQILAQEVAASILTTEEAKEVKTWAKAGDGALQLPSILIDENTFTRVLSGIAADVNFESESENAKLGVTIASNVVGKWVLALTALKK